MVVMGQREEEAIGAVAPGSEIQYYFKEDSQLKYFRASRK